METKICRDCHTEKPLTDFYPDKTTKDGYRYECKECCSIHHKIYRKTKERIVNVAYSRQKQNCKFRDHELPTYTLMELKWWMFSQPKFHKMYEEYVASNHNIWMKPSVDRINSDLSYTLDNIQLVTWRENHDNFGKESSKKTKGVNRGAEMQKKPVKQLDLEGNLIKGFSSLTEAHKEIGVGTKDIKKVCNGKRLTAYGYKWEWDK